MKEEEASSSEAGRYGEHHERKVRAASPRAAPSFVDQGVKPRPIDGEYVGLRVVTRHGGS